MSTKRPPCTKIFPLNNGSSMPAVGLGTWQGSPGTSDESAMVASIVHSLRSGYRLLDTAQMYAVEGLVGRAVRESGVPREDVTVVTKFWVNRHHDPARALADSLEAMRLDYVDVLLMHMPCGTTPDGTAPLGARGSPTFVETWKMMEALVGPRCRAIGVSNFSQKALETLLAGADVVPVVNQVELHAFNPCLRLVPFCQSKGIHVMAWASLGGGDGAPFDQILTHQVFVDMAKAKGCSVGVVHLSWAVQRGITVIPRTRSHARLEDNMRLVTLTDEEMKIMNSAKDTIAKCRNMDKYRDKPEGKITILGWTMEELGWEDAEGNWLN